MAIELGQTCPSAYAPIPSFVYVYSTSQCILLFIQAKYIFFCLSLPVQLHLYENVWQHCCVAYNCCSFILLASTSALVKNSACIPDVCLSVYITGSRWFAYSLFTQVRMFPWSGEKRGNKLVKGILAVSAVDCFFLSFKEKSK